MTTASQYLDRIERAEAALPAARLAVETTDMALCIATQSGSPVAEAQAAYDRAWNFVSGVRNAINAAQTGLRAAERRATERADMEASVLVGGE